MLHNFLIKTFDIIFAHNQPNAQFLFMYVYFYSLHAPDSCVPNTLTV